MHNSKYSAVNRAVSMQRQQHLEKIFEDENLAVDSDERAKLLNFRMAHASSANRVTQFGFSIAHTLAVRGVPNELR